MRVTVLTCFESNEERASFVCESCRLKGCETSSITSDFSHVRKQKRETIPEDYRAIDTVPYQKNLSMARM